MLCFTCYILEEDRLVVRYEGHGDSLHFRKVVFASVSDVGKWSEKCFEEDRLVVRYEGHGDSSHFRKVVFASVSDVGKCSEKCSEKAISTAMPLPLPSPRL